MANTGSVAKFDTNWNNSLQVVSVSY